MYKPETVAAVRKSCVFDRLPIRQAAAVNGVGVGTVRRWKLAALAQGDDWDRLRASTSMSTGNMDDLLASMVNDFVTLHQSLTEEITTSSKMDARSKITALNSLADSFSKCISAAGRASPKLNRLAFAMELVERLGRFIQNNHPEHALAFAEILEPFGAEVSRHYG